MTWTKQPGGVLIAPDFIIKPTFRFVTLYFKGWEAGQFSTVQKAKEAAELISPEPSTN